MPGAHLFLSYSHLEVDFALRLAADLREAGVQVWMDRLDAALLTGDDWRRAIETALDTAVGLIAVVSPAYNVSDYCRKELARVSDRKKRVYPVLLREVDTPPLDLQVAQWLDFTRFRDANCYRSAMDKLVHDIQVAQGLEPRLDPESSYLLHLITEMEASRGVLAFVGLAGEAVEAARHSTVRPPPRVMQAWGLGSEFALLGEDSAGSDSTDVGELICVESITDALDDYSRFVLLGAPGAGKTTTLHRLAMGAARERLGRPSAPLPLLLRLPAWADEATFEEFVRAHWPLNSDPLDMSGDLLLLLDGLNEMGASGFDKAAALKGFLLGRTDCRVVITCRSGDYSTALNLALPRVEVQPLDEARVHRFAAAYLEDAADDFLERIGLGNVQRAPAGRFPGSTRRLANLARNPYLLVAMMAVSEESDTGALPANPGVLFRDLVRVLWEREHQHRTVGWVRYKDMLARFSALARDVLTQGLSTELPRELVSSHADPDLVEAACRASLLEQTEQGTRFYHQLMQEYFAAEGLPADALLAHVEPPGFDGAVGLLHGPWDEVIIAKAGLLADADDFVNGMAQTNPYLAAEAVASGARISDAMRAGLIEKLLITVFDKPQAPWEWPTDSEADVAIGSFGALGAVEAIEPIIAALRINNTGIISAACDALAEIGDAAAAPALIAELGGWDSTGQALRQSGMRRRILAQIAGDAERTLILLGEVAVPACLGALNRGEHYNDDSLAALLYILGRIGDPRAIQPILEFSDTLLPFSVTMASMDPLHAYTYQALGRLRAGQAIPLLAEALRGDSPDPKALPHAEHWDGRPDLAERLSLQAARALALIGSEGAREVLRAHGLPETPVAIDAYD